MSKDNNREELIEEMKFLQHGVAELEKRDVESKRTKEQLRQNQQRVNLDASAADLGYGSGI